MKNYIVIIIAFFSFASCTKEIDIDLNSASPQIVIEGSITDQPAPYTVKLSKTVNFSESNNYPPVTGALVIISDNTGVVDTLTETVSGLYQAHSITGTQGNTYTLKVIAEGKQYNAVSTMPYKVNLDSIRFNPFAIPGSGTTTFGAVPLYLDPIATGNCYRFFLSANGKFAKSYLVSNDNIGNGSVNQNPLFSQDVEIHAGDSVKVTMCCIDVNTYNYYYTLSQLSGNGPGGGSTPSNPPNNITGTKALGVFSAYTMQIKTVIAQ